MRCYSYLDFVVKRSKKQVEHVANFIPAEDFWAAMTCGHRIIGEQYPDGHSHVDVLKRQQFAQAALVDTSLITEDDRDLAQELIAFQRGRLLDMIAGKISNYGKIVVTLFMQEEVDVNQSTNFTFGVNQPGYYIVHRENQRRGELIERSKLTSQHVGKLKDRIEVRGTVLRVFPSKNTVYQETNGHILLGDDGNLYLYWHSKQDVYEDDYVYIRGTVKAHTDGNTTKLNRVLYLVKE